MKTSVYNNKALKKVDYLNLTLKYNIKVKITLGFYVIPIVFKT